ncbi:TonB-dependent siderophore receptor [Herbaspirillum sp. WKF16]|uniref:TonB-dependent receptor n=1 Tax=Herbaspirillum sp. WKF16 TaxID=3028312 RepID=UPI0023A9734A|nr:TonB-dependent siderophore receptor [Herbaspirillum sp. WKF16]WDZ96672.1 TonB-dependent siderophore receptor [Herbaspirillum sp. WKF16]
MGKALALNRHTNFAFQPTALAAAVSLALAAPAFAQTADDAAALPTVTVTGASENGLKPAYAGGQVARGGSLGVLGTQDVMDTPFSTTNYTADTLKNLQARTVGDVIGNDASVRNTNGAAGFGDSYQIRGFAVSVDDTALNGLYGLVSLGRMSTAMLERVEVLKGPGTLMSGMGPAGSVGGAINLVTKRAGEEPVSSVTASYMSSAQFGLQGDIGRRFGENKEWGIRVNALYADGATGISGSNQQQSMGSVALDYTTRRLRWTLDAYTLHEDTRNFRPQFSIGTLTMPDAPSGNSNFLKGSTLQLDDKVVASRLEYDLNDQLTAYGAIGYHTGSSAQTFASSTINTLAGAADVTNAYYDQKTITTSSDVGLRARFRTAGIGHTLTLGATSLDKQLDWFYAPGATTIATNLYGGVQLPPVGSARTNPIPQSQTRLTSYSVTDTLSMIDGRLLLTAGLRRQQAYAGNLQDGTSSNARGYSPVVGVVVKPVDALSLYANYTVGLSAGEVVGGTYANRGQILSPYKATQYEAGAKVDWGRVMTTAAVFEINRANGVADTVTNTYTQNGRQRVRGLELSAVGELQRGLRLMGGATFFDAKQFHTDGGTNDGKDIGAVPKQNFNLGAEWDTPWLSGLTLNSRVIRTGSMYYDGSNNIRVPGWTRLDLGARYASKLAGQTVTYRANIENLFDKNYWVMQNGYAGYGAGRTFILSAQVDF